MYSSIPGLTILNPTSIDDVKNMINYALFELDGPVVIRYPKGEISLNLSVFSKDLKWNVIKPGADYIVSYTPCLDEVISSNEINNLNVGIVGVSLLNKIDEEFIKNLKPKSTLYVYEDVIYPGSLASIILKYVNDHNLCIKVKSLCIDSTYIKCGKVRELKEEYKISINDLINLINKNNK
jgi:1-deoxy-D-xylulose-5-phosphate synthase